MAEEIFLFELYDPEVKDGIKALLLSDKGLKRVREFVEELQEKYRWDEFYEIEEVFDWIEEEVKKAGIGRLLNFHVI